MKYHTDVRWLGVGAGEPESASRRAPASRLELGTAESTLSRICHLLHAHAPPRRLLSFSALNIPLIKPPYRVGPALVVSKASWIFAQ